MRRLLMAAALSTLSLAASGCGEPKRIVTNLAPPSERLQCVAAGERPKIPSEHQIAWERVLTASQARAEHEEYVRKARTREVIVALYIVQTEGRLFACSDNAAWVRQWYAETAR